jgi:hypothetical protein
MALATVLARTGWLLSENLSISTSEHLEEWEWVQIGGKPRVDAVFFAEVQPQLPRMGGFGGARENDSGSDRLLYRAVITKEVVG